jgi:branched-chain amino acid transport system substrate-binding protein
MTGLGESIGVTFERAIEYAIPHFNESDEILPDTELDYVFKDTQSDPAEAQTVAREAIVRDEVDLLTGCALSNNAATVAEFAGSEDIPYFIGAAVSRALTSGSACQPTTFRSSAHTGQASKTEANWFLENLGEDPYVIWPDYNRGQEMKNSIQSVFDEADANIAKTTKVSLSFTDWRPVLDDIHSVDPNYVLIGSTGASVIAFLRQVANSDFAYPIGGQTMYQDAMGTLTAEQFDNLPDTFNSTMMYGQNLDNERNAAFVEGFREEHGRPPGMTGGQFYVSLESIVQILDSAGGAATDDFVSSGEGITAETVLGDVPIRACDHQGMPPIPVGKYVDINTDAGLGVCEVVGEVDGADVIEQCDQIECSM